MTAGASSTASGPVPPDASRVPRAAVLAASVIAAFIAPFMSSAMNIALPSIGRDFSLNALKLGWTSTAYLLAAAVFLVPFGKLADISGRKRIFLLGAAVGLAASVLCALSPNGDVLIGARLMQGFGAAMIFSTGVALLTSAFPPRERGRVLGLNAGFTYLGLSMGPVLGGFMTQHLGWRSLFWLSAVLGAVLLAVIVLGLKGEWADARGEAFDAPGAALLGTALTSLMLGLSWLPRPAGAGLLLAAAAAFALFVLRERRARTPLLELALFRTNPVFAFSNLAALINYSATFAVGFLMSLHLQHILGYSAQRAGLVLIVQPAVMALFSPAMGRLSDRIEPRLLASAGMGLSAVGLFGLAWLGPHPPLALVIAALAVLGFGFALFSAPNTNAVMSSVEKNRLGVASAMLGTMRMTGQMLSMGLAMLLFSLFMGRVKIAPEVYPRFLTAFRVGFILFAVLCAAGVFASLARGRMHK